MHKYTPANKLYTRVFGKVTTLKTAYLVTSGVGAYVRPSLLQLQNWVVKQRKLKFCHHVIHAKVLRVKVPSAGLHLSQKDCASFHGP